MLRIYLCLFISVVFINLLSLGNADIPSNRLCADPKCTEAISEAQGSVVYSAKDINELSFKRGDKLTIISKSKEKNGYWGAKLGDKIGFVPKHLIKETRVYHSSDQLLPVEGWRNDNKNNVDIDNIKLAANESTIEIASSVPEVNDLKSPVNTASVELSGKAVNETSLPYEEIDGTKIYFNYHEEKEVTPSTTSQADTSTKTVESAIPSPILNSDAEPSNDNLKVDEKITIEKKLVEQIVTETKLEENEDDDDDDDDDDDEGDYDDGDDKDDDEEEENESPELTTEVPVAKNLINPTEKSEEVKIINDDSSTTTEKSKEKSAVEDLNSEKVAQETKSNEETAENIGSGWSMLNTVANMVLSAAINEDNSDASSENIDRNPGNATEENILIEEAVENLNNNYIQKESLPGSDLSENAEQKLHEKSISHPVSETTPSPVVENRDNVPSDLTKEIFFDIDSNEKTSNEIVKNATESPNYTSSSLNENIKNIESENDRLNLVKEQNSAESPSAPNLERNNENNFQSIQKDTTTRSKEKIVTTQSYGEEEITPSLAKEFESTTESAPNVLNPLTPPNVQYETVRSDEIISNFVPMSEAAKVEEVTTETYQPKKVFSEPSVTQFKEDTQDSEIMSDSLTEPGVEIPATVEEVTEGVTKEQSGYFSMLLDTVYDYLGLKQKAEKSEDFSSETFGDPSGLKESELQKIDDSKVKAVPEGNCKSVFGLESNCEDAPLASHTIWDSWYSPSRNMDVNATFYSTLLYLIITAVTVLLFTLGYYFIEENRKCSPLIAKVNNLEQQLMVSSAECVLLKEELQTAKDKIVLYEDSSNNELVISLQNEVKEAQKIKSELEATIESLQQELDAATEAGLDLNRMLSEVLTQKGGSDSLMESVERLQAQLDSQQKIIDDMNTSLVMKNQENEGLQVELGSANDKIDNLEEELNDIKQNLHMLLKEKEDVTIELTSRNNALQSRISQLTECKEKEVLGLKKNNEDLCNQLSTLLEKLTVKEGELNALKESVKVLKTESGRNIDELFDVTRVKAELSKAQKEKITLQDKLQAEEEARRLLEDRIKSSDSEVQKLRESYTGVEKEKIEAQTKLEVLSKYFKEKEMQLQKELGLQEAMWLQKQGDDSTVYERMTSLQEEVENYKSQNEMLKKEILDQERGLKSQIATLEKKAHENWVAARQAERKLEETKQEAAQLRNRLTMIEKNINNDLEAKPNHRLTEEINGGEAFSPLLHDASSPMPFPPLSLDPNNPALLPPGFIPPPMFMPPPGGFMPPPPPFLPGDRRPPPLGRMSSPPLNNRFSPSPDYSMERMSPPPLSPPVRNYKSPNESERDRDRFRHRTPPFPSFPSRDWEDSHSSGHSGFRPISSQRDARRDNKGSTLSSGHSSSDSLDKSSRHSGRV